MLNRRGNLIFFGEVYGENFAEIITLAGGEDARRVEQFVANWLGDSKSVERQKGLGFVYEIETSYDGAKDRRLF